jgi:glycosyltransferase involved in cell wall biosynthesis
MTPFQPMTTLQFRSANGLSSNQPPISPRKKVLFLNFRFPYPLSGGDRLKSYHLLQHLSGIADVDLICLDAWNSGYGANLAEIKKIVKNVTVVPFKHTAAWARVFFTLPTKTPVEYGYYDSPQMQEAVDKALASNHYDLIVCFFLRTAIYVKHVVDIPKLLVAEDQRLLMQERSSEKFSFTGEYFVRANDAKKLRAYEPEMMRNFDLVTFVAKPDMEGVLSLDPNIPSMIVTNGVDTDRLQYSVHKRENAILYAGVLSVYHNKNMVERLAKKILPRIRKASPDTRLYIVGKDPDTDMRILIGDTDGAELHSNVPDVMPFYERAAIFVHPQVTGSGIQNKLLEALALGCAVVTTPVGASGIEGLRDGVNALIRTTDDEMARAAIDLLDNETLRTTLAENGRKLIESRYTWNTVFKQFDEALKTVVPDFFSVTA